MSGGPSPLSEVHEFGARIGAAWAEGWREGMRAAAPVIRRVGWQFTLFALALERNPHRRRARTGHRHRGTLAWHRRYSHRRG